MDLPASNISVGSWHNVHNVSIHNPCSIFYLNPLSTDIIETFFMPYHIKEHETVLETSAEKPYKKQHLVYLKFSSRLYSVSMLVGCHTSSLFSKARSVSLSLTAHRVFQMTTCVRLILLSFRVAQ